MVKWLKNCFIIVLTICSLVILCISYLGLNYPIKELAIITKYSQENNLDIAMVFSIINIESSFRPNVKSKADAIGLMQLKVATANDMAQMQNESVVTEIDLFDKEINIKYGCRYLRYLIDYYDNEKLALCAYNAGLGNVNTWLLNKNYLDSDGMLIIIPYPETEQYLNKYEKNIKIYQKYDNLGLI